MKPKPGDLVEHRYHLKKGLVLKLKSIYKGIDGKFCVHNALVSWYDVGEQWVAVEHIKIISEAN
jgi:hypothetical protein